MEKLSKKISKHLKLLELELKNYKFKYSWSFNSVIIEIIEQDTQYDEYIVIKDKLFCQKENGDKIEFYIMLKQYDEIEIDKLKDIFSKIEQSLWDFVSKNSKNLLGLRI